jgi:hypothetical protein
MEEAKPRLRRGRRRQLRSRPVYLGRGYDAGALRARGARALPHRLAQERAFRSCIGSAGDTGTNRGVDEFVSMIKELAQEHRIPKFKVGYFYSEVPKDYLKKS